MAGDESDLQIGQKETLPMARGREPIQTVRAVGLMSGTSMDGVDVAIIETDGQEIVTLGRTGFFPYSEADRALLRLAARDAALLEDRNARPGSLALADAMIRKRAAADAGESVLRHRVRSHGSAGLCLSRGAAGEESADYVSDDHGGR
jgi:1,6-anhydro-N-acetylmuramate kinase